MLPQHLPSKSSFLSLRHLPFKHPRLNLSDAKAWLSSLPAPPVISPFWALPTTPGAGNRPWGHTPSSCPHSRAPELDWIPLGGQMRGLPALPTIFLTQGLREPWTQLRTGCLLPTHLLHTARCPPNPTLAPTPGDYALHSSPQAARRCPPPSASALGPVVSEGRTHLHHGDAEAAHGAQRPSILQLLRGLCVQLDLLLLLRGRDAQEVLGQLSDVHLRECGVSAGPPARARLPVCTTWGRRSSLQAPEGLCSREQGAQHTALRGGPARPCLKAGLTPSPDLQAALRPQTRLSTCRRSQPQTRTTASMASPPRAVHG